MDQTHKSRRRACSAHIMRRTRTLPFQVKRDGPTAASQAHPAYTLPRSLLPSPARLSVLAVWSGPNRARELRGDMLLRGRAAAAALLLLLLVTAAAKAEEGALLPAEPMELYFSPAELARIAGYGEEPVSSVLVSGQVACELCLRPGSDLLAFELPGIPCLSLLSSDRSSRLLQAINSACSRRSSLFIYIFHDSIPIAIRKPRTNSWPDW